MPSVAGQDRLPRLTAAKTARFNAVGGESPSSVHFFQIEGRTRPASSASLMITCSFSFSFSWETVAIKVECASVDNLAA